MTACACAIVGAVVVGALSKHGNNPFAQFFREGDGPFSHLSEAEFSVYHRLNVSVRPSPPVRFALSKGLLEVDWRDATKNPKKLVAVTRVVSVLLQLN